MSKYILNDETNIGGIRFENRNKIENCKTIVFDSADTEVVELHINKGYNLAREGSESQIKHQASFKKYDLNQPVVTSEKVSDCVSTISEAIRRGFEMVRMDDYLKPHVGGWEICDVWFDNMKNVAKSRFYVEMWKMVGEGWNVTAPLPTRNILWREVMFEKDMDYYSRVISRIDDKKALVFIKDRLFSVTGMEYSDEFDKLSKVIHCRIMDVTA